MKIVGITGGIGSGKTTVAKMFQDFGIPIYISDIEAKALMNRSKIIKRKLLQLFGDKAYVEGQLNREFIAQAIFNDKSLLTAMNKIVHPKVGAHFKKWSKKHSKNPYVIKESALLFQTGDYKTCDFIILVIAPAEERMKRVIERDKSSQKKVQAIMNNQSNDKDNSHLANFVIENTSLIDTKKQVQSIHNEIIKALSD